MKFLLPFILLFSLNARAVDICSFTETWDFVEAMDFQDITPSKTSKNHNRFAFIEKEMIHLTVALQDWLGGVSREEALNIFQEGGEVHYYNISGKTYAMVHYWPGENEYGAFFELTNSAFKLVAKIGDSFIQCEGYNY